VDEVGDASGSAVERFLKWESDENRRTAALHGALPRRFSAEVFEVAAGSTDHLPWLLQQPFVTEQADGYRYHDVVRSQMLRVLRRREPGEWRRRHLALAADAPALERAYHRLCAEGATALPAALAGLVEALSVRRSLSRQWVPMIVQAGRDADHPDVLRRGAELAEAGHYISLIGLLVDDRSLPAATRALAHAQRGGLLRRDREFDAALADFEAAIDLAPDMIVYVGERGETLRRMGRPAEAVADLDRLVAAEPDNDWAYACRGGVFQALDRLDESLADLDKAIELRPTYTWALGARAETLRRLERFPQALADLDRAIERDPEYLYGLVNRAVILFTTGERDRAADDLARVIELDGEDGDWARRLLNAIRNR
jgi:tetratricopeptide (TPR) repeat protein